MIVLFTDFGPEGPYIGQMEAAIYRTAGALPVINLLANAPAHDPKAAAYLLSAYHGDFPRHAVFLCVVDPGVGGARAPVAVHVDGQWFVGPDNGLFNVVGMRGREVQWWDITWRPERLSATFHGRDLFAPIAARLAQGEQPPGSIAEPAARIDRSWPADFDRIVFIDHFGNAVTGIRAETVPEGRLAVAGHVLPHARTYSEVPVGQGFWYENANGLVEISVNRGSAAKTLSLNLGDPVAW